MSARLENAVAIIGMAARFPGANSHEEYWRNLCEGREAIERIPESELEDGLTAADRAQGTYVAARALLRDVDQFDAAFFQFLPRDAELTDPQQRLLLECAWRAFEDAGYDPAAVAGSVGVYAGSSINTYLLLHLGSDARFRQEFTRSYQVGSFAALTGNGQDFLATRISYKLNLRGPAMTVQSACSTGLLAVSQAWQSLMSYQCDLALAGAASISFPQRRGYFYQDGGMVSPDGHCRPFDRNAAGTVFGSGGGMVLLKRAEDAVRDGDHIYALVLGAGVNNDGGDKMGYAAPSGAGQAEAVAQAYAVAGVDPATVDYVECHGTGTPLGDPIEVAALRQVFGESPRSRPCVLSSAKGNIGHIDVAAGIAGLMKAALALDKGSIPGTLHYTEPNPGFNLDATPFAITGATQPWPRGGQPRRAGVSAFGVGGTNVHLVLEEAPEPSSATTAARPVELFCLSARSEAALAAQCANLAARLDGPELALADVAWTLAAGRRSFPHRLALHAVGKEELRERLLDAATVKKTCCAGDTPPQVAYLFPGQGSQYAGMGADLYRTQPVYRAAVDACCDLLTVEDMDLRALLLAARGTAEGAAAAAQLDETEFAQPALFVTGYALAQLWESWGVTPAVVVGHSLGEITAATVAGVFSLEDGLRLAVSRGRWMQQMPAGRMLAVRMQPQLLQMRLPETLAIAAMNSPEITVVSGPDDAVAAFEAQLTNEKIVTMRLGARRAFHSPIMRPVADSIAGFLQGVALQAPTIPLISTATGEPLDAAQACSPAYWAEQAVRPVNFAAAAQALLNTGSEAFLEAGPGDLLCGLMRANLPRRSGVVLLPSLPTAAISATASAWSTLAPAVGALWMRGAKIDWNRFYADEPRQRVPLPTYPFERKRYWIDAPAAAPSAEPAPTETAVSSQPAPPVVAALIPAELTASPLQERFMSAPNTQRIATILEELSGLELPPSEYVTSFLELGFDSLLLTQVAQRLQSEFGVKLGFRQLLDDLSSVDLLAAWFAQRLPAATAAPSAPAAAAATAPVSQPANLSGNPSLQQMQAAIESLQKQLQILAGVPTAAAATNAPQAAVQPVSTPAAAETAERNTLHARPVLRHEAMTAEQKAFIAALTERWCRKTARSKQYTASYRRELADPRVVSGFRPEWKEMVYSIVSSRSHGSKLWDIDGNEYIDLLNGFGPNMFGHSPEFVTRAMAQQMVEGFAIGPQTPLAGKAARMLAEMTGCERVTFCNTGSEAVMAAMRLARTVTGRDRIVYFTGDYHGQFDEVLGKALRRKGEFAAQPSAPGIPRNSLENIVVLDYGTEESLRYLEENIAQLAAVLVEPVQSRHPNLQPKAFLEKLRELTRRTGTALIFDEVVNGFRIHPRGAQGYYGIDADMVTYGKVVAGGMPIGILAGTADFMDALDGGPWNFGDASVPEKGVTFFAGTFVRHPLTMAALCATLEHIRAAGPELYARLNEKSDRFAARLCAVAEAGGSQITIENCGSVMFLRVPPEYRFSGLLFYLMREKGVFLLEGFPMYLTTAHTEEDLDRVVDAFTRSIAELQACGLLPGTMPVVTGEPLAADELPLTEPQLEIMLAAQASPEASKAFNESFRIMLEGPLDADALERAWDALIARHDALRLSLTGTGDRMTAGAKRRIPLTKESADHAGLERILAEEGAEAFDLRGALVRARLVQLAPEQHVLIVTAHHLVCDGWSVNVLIQELGQLYTANTSGGPSNLPPALAFSAYAMHTLSRETRAAEAEDLEYWKRQLTPLPELQTLPTDNPRPEQRSYAGDTLLEAFPKELTQALRKAGASAGCTLFTTLLGAWNILLWRLTNNPDGITMIPAAAQSQLADQVLVGHCVHLLPVRSPIDPTMSAKDYLKALKPVVLDAYEHQRATYGRIVQAIAPPRIPGRLPLSEVQFNLEQVGRNAAFSGLSAAVSANGKRAVNFDLFLNIVDTPDGLRLECDYSTALYRESTMRLWLSAYRTLLEAMVANLDRQVAQLLLVPAPVQTRLDALNKTALWPLPAASVPEMVAEAFSRYSTQTAVDFYGLEMSRAELADRSDRLASWLLRHGITAGSLVGIYMDRSLEMVVAILGVLKSGAAYVPLDPIFPAARIEQIVEETRLPVMLTLSRHLDALPGSGARPLALDDAAHALDREPVRTLPRIGPEALAYVIFTSGSTGKPKGVEVTHGALVNLLTDLGRRLEIGPADRWLAVTTLSFDIAILELLLPLVTGGTVVIAHRDDVADGMRLLELIDASRITTLQATPVTWRMLAEQGFRAPAGFKMLCGGEAWPATLAAELLEKSAEPCARMWNMYGPTETTVWSSVTEVMAADPAVLIGPPIANTRFYVLDERLQPVLPGTPGELCIAGTGVARGYFHRPELTAERFLADPFVPGERMYRTGDEVRQSIDGNILFLGRLDHQVKLRGYRLELGEVEAAVRAFAQVTGAVVVLRNGADGEPYLAAYYTASREISTADLKQFLRDRLPAYMVPAMLWQLDRFPMTPNGKIDRRALPDLWTAGAEVRTACEPPTGPTETTLAAIVREVLGRKEVGRKENLLELGADSLRMFQIASRAHRRGLPVTARQLLQLHTIEAVAAALDANPQNEPAALTGVGPQLGRISRENYQVTW